MDELKKQVEKLKLNEITHHIFICADQTKPKCCDKDFSNEIWEYLKEKVSSLPTNVVVQRTKANCLRICKKGPIVVIYPQGIWYHSVTKEVIDRIIQEHILQKKPVTEYLLF